MSLLLDALDRTLRNRHCASRWHRLMSIWESTPDDVARIEVLNALANRHDDPNSDALRLTFLARATGKACYEDDAAERVLEARPIDADRLAAFMAFRWLSALQDIEGRAEFTAALLSGRLPEMAKCLMREAVQLVPPGIPPVAPNEIRRVAVVVPYIGDPFHTPSMMAVEQCAVLAREGCQVRIFSAQELTPPDALLYRGDARELNLPALNARAWAEILPGGVGMTISDSRFSLPGRWRKLMPVLAGFDPDAVLLVGLFSPLAAALHTVRPVAGISVNSIAPISPLDVWLSGNREAAVHHDWNGVFPSPETIVHPYRIRRSARQWRTTRMELGLRRDAVVWITAGFRLEHEIRDEWAARMLQLMARHPQVVWLLVGGEGRIPQALQHAAPGRVLALATRNDLPGVFRCVDIYVNPPRMGGGFSVAEAMAEGLPVVSMAGSDGGDKVGELASAAVDTYLERLTALTEHPALRVEAGEAMRRRFAERFDLDASGPSLMAALRRAAALARQRLIPFPDRL